MFDCVSDGDLIAVMGEESREESAGIGRRLAAVGELDARRAVEWSERALWVADPFEEVAAEVSAALNISRGRAGTQVRYARELRDRLPKVAAVLRAGDIDFRMVVTIINRTGTVDSEFIAEVDAALAQLAPRWMKLSGPKLADRIDRWIATFDPDGVRVPPDVDEQRYVEVTPTVPGMAGISAHLHATDAAAFDARLDALAATVCKHDPRTPMQRRCDAVGALAAGAQALVCGCGLADCPMLGKGTAVPVVIHLLAEQATVDGEADTPGYLPGFGVQPAESVRAQAATATLAPLVVPQGGQEGYRPSVRLVEFIRWRDLTCRWPGCDARVCDVDHSVPYPAGPTHPSNLKQFCRTHHLIKTFYSGPGGWSERQLPDGTVVFVSPAGCEYTTVAGGALLFPVLATPTGNISVPETTARPGPCRGLAMPTRKRSRDAQRRTRIQAERRVRAEINAECARLRAAEIARTAAAYPPNF